MAEPTPPAPSETTTVEGPVLDLVSQWEAFLAAVNQQDKRVGGLLKDCYPLEATTGQVTLGVYYSFHQKQLEDTKRRGLLEDVLSRTLGSPVRVQFKLTPKTKAEMDAERPKNPLQEATDDPVVKEAVRMGGKITGISLDT